jgi:hypothetical protein
MMQERFTIPRSTLELHNTLTAKVPLDALDLDWFADRLQADFGLTWWSRLW